MKNDRNLERKKIKLSSDIEWIHVMESPQYTIMLHSFASKPYHVFQRCFTMLDGLGTRLDLYCQAQCIGFKIILYLASVQLWMKGGPCASLQLLQADLELSQVNITNLFVGDNKYSHHRRPTGESAVISFPSFSYNDLEEMSRHSYFIFTNNLYCYMIWQRMNVQET